VGQGRVEAVLRRACGLEPAAVGVEVLARATRQRMEAVGVRDEEAYAEWLASPRELDALLELVVVRETSFFRDDKPFAALGQWVARQWMPSHAGTTLRVLCAPCSTGEEPYSAVMALLDAGLAPSRIQVDAVDISAHALAVAQRGEYGPYSLRGKSLPPAYVTPAPSGLAVAEVVRGRVSFERGNMVDPGFLAGRGPYHVAFCRNLLIYLDDPARRVVVGHLDRLVAADGVLFVGSAEPIILAGESFHRADTPGAFMMERVRETRREPGKGTERTSRAPAPPPPVAAEGLAPRRLTVSPAPVLSPSPGAPSLARARALADGGDLLGAAAECDRLLESGGPSAEVFALRGVVELARDKVSLAEEMLHKALYLRPDHEEALTCLALLRERAGDRHASGLLWQRARRSRDARGGEET
jgi:chemotaxis protein methyltransferase WspC